MGSAPSKYSFWTSITIKARFTGGLLFGPGGRAASYFCLTIAHRPRDDVRRLPPLVDRDGRRVAAARGGERGVRLAPDDDDLDRARLPRAEGLVRVGERATGPGLDALVGKRLDEQLGREVIPPLPRALRRVLDDPRAERLLGRKPFTPGHRARRRGVDEQEDAVVRVVRRQHVEQLLPPGGADAPRDDVVPERRERRNRAVATREPVAHVHGLPGARLLVLGKGEVVVGEVVA